MTEKEIAKEILIKLIDVKAISLKQPPITESIDKISASNTENLKTVCDAYAAIFKAVTFSEREDCNIP